MNDDPYSDPEIAELYDVLNTWADSDEFYLDLVMRSDSVLDVGCGTGMILRTARYRGHHGRLVGLDPAQAMLDVGRRDRSDIEWTSGDLTTVRYDREFDLAIMSGHAFQELVSDEELRQNLAAVRAALSDTGRFVFETRNPGARAWEQWTPEFAVEIPHPDGGVIWDQNDVELPVVGDIVTFVSRCTSPTFEGVKTTRSTLRFLDQTSLNGFLCEAGLAIEAQYGFWDRSPVSDSSPEIITIARRD